ncbi:MAG: hypothetical protein HY243_15675 [Proteobacteria bacterium]|nr:hypothetical protein [Pseudomonadota bacterium]
MRFWSEGLGERQLVMNLGKAAIKRQGEITLLSGVVDSPAPWEYEVKIQREDWARILQTAVTKEACGFIATHTTLVQLLAMAWSIVVFVILLAWFRTARLLGFEAERVAVPGGSPIPTAAPALKRK